MTEKILRMQDRFKFKGYWYNDVLEEWRVLDEPEFITGDGTAEIWCNSEGGAYPELPDDAELHLCQCTGLKDKNGKLIYEGDIVIEHYHNTKETTIKKVFFDKNVIGFAYTDGIEYNQLCITDGDRLQVIGNIYENKELLDEPN